jgi:hypothetical protein
VTPAGLGVNLIGSIWSGHSGLKLTNFASFRQILPVFRCASHGHYIESAYEAPLGVGPGSRVVVVSPAAGFQCPARSGSHLAEGSDS